MPDSHLLETESLTINFGGLYAVDSVDFHLEKGEIVGLIGPNGSGKSTFFNLITGIYRPTKGRILFRGETLHEKKPHQIAKKGIARTFQNNRLFSDISVLDNVILGMYHRQKTNLLDTLFRYHLVKSELKDGAEKAMGLLGFFSEELGSIGQNGWPNYPMRTGEELKSAGPWPLNPTFSCSMNLLAECRRRKRKN